MRLIDADMIEKAIEKIAEDAKKENASENVIAILGAFRLLIAHTPPAEVKIAVDCKIKVKKCTNL